MEIKVKDLMVMLEKQDPEALVVISRDAEGNSFSPISEDISNGYFDAEYWDFLESCPEEPSEYIRSICLWPS